MELFSRKSDGLMGMDITAAGIKLVELGKSRRGYELKSMALAPLPRDAIVENTIIDSVAVTRTIADAVEMARPVTRNVAFAVSGNAVIIRRVTMPAMSEFELEPLIADEADQYIPFDMDEVFLDFQVLGKTPEDDTQMEVLLAACKRDVIEDYQLALGEAGLVASCVDCAVFALENAMRGLMADRLKGDVPGALADPEEARAHALVNIGASLLNINILKNGRMAFVRDQFYGGNNLTEAIQKAEGFSLQAADQMKKDNFQSIRAEVLDEFYTGLAGELARSLDFYATSHADSPVQKIFLSGGGALIPGIADEVEQRLNIEAEVLNPLLAVRTSARKFDADYLNRIGPRMMVTAGLALRSFDA